MQLSQCRTFSELTLYHLVITQSSVYEKKLQSLLCSADAREIALALPAQVRSVCDSTAANHSSMRVDIEGGKQTEIDAIVGWLLSSFTPHPPATPILSELYDAVKEREPEVLGA